MRKRAIIGISVAFALLSTTAIGKDINGDGVETILLPMALTSIHRLQGAFGTEWKIEIWFHNTSTEHVLLQPATVCSNPLPGSCTGGFPPGFLGLSPSTRNNHGDGGALYYLPADIADQVYISVRLYEITRNAQPTGVDIPVVREHEFFSGTSEFLGIPAGPGIRSTLRVYDPRLVKGSSVSVEILSPDGSVVGTAVLSPGNDPVVPARPPIFTSDHMPGFAAIYDLTSTFPQLNALDRFHIRLKPITSGMEYWAFVSVTDNETQHVGLITSH